MATPNQASLRVMAKLPLGQRLRNDDFEFVLLSPGMVDIKTQEPALLLGVGGRVGQRETLVSTKQITSEKAKADDAIKTADGELKIAKQGGSADRPVGTGRCPGLRTNVEKRDAEYGL